jgi:uncharacterized protein (DUF1778 family)
MGGVMSEDLERSTENDLAEQYYERRDDDSEWGDSEPLETPARLTVTLSVRFAPEELDAVRAAAERLGMKPTAFIRQAAVEAVADGPVDRVRVVNDLARAVELMRDAQQALAYNTAVRPRQAS